MLESKTKVTVNCQHPEHNKISRHPISTIIESRNKSQGVSTLRNTGWYIKKKMIKCPECNEHTKPKKREL